jgi:competence CoiA-like predicted nuclease
MEFALNLFGERCKAQHGMTATCPQCSGLMVPKCGRLVMHHWAHEANECDCDPWWEPECIWHRGWKELVPEEQREVSRAGHRADIVRTDGTVVELQHSSISLADIAEREAAYGRMVWLFDGRDISVERLILRNRDRYYTFRWKHPRKHYGACSKPVYIDLGENVFRMKRLHLSGGPPYRGWGRLAPRWVFEQWLTESTQKRVERFVA